MNTNTTITTAVPVIPLPVLHDPESITPTIPWNHSERRHSIHATLDHHPCETESHFDGWNSQQFQEDPFPNTTITTTTYDDQTADSEPIPFRMIRRPSLSRQPMMVTNTLRLQDVLGRLDLDDTETNDTDNHHEHSLLQNVTNDSPGIDNDHDVDCSRTRKQQDLSWACSIDNDDTMDSYFWNTKSPCKWYHHHHHHHPHPQQQQQQQLPHDTSYNHSNKKRRRYNPQLSSPLVVDDAFATALEDIDTSTTNDTGWTTFPCQNEDHHEDTIDGNPFEWTNSDMMDPYSTTSNHTVHPNTSFSPSLLSTLDVTTTTTKTVPFTTPVPTLRKKPQSLCHSRTDSNTIPPPLTTAPLPTKQSYCVDTCDTTRVVSAHSTTTPVGETNTTNQDHSHVDRTCPEDAYDNDDDDAILLESSTTIETIADPTWCQLLLQQKEAIQENDLLLRNNRQVLHRLAYEQIMGIHAHHSKPNT